MMNLKTGADIAVYLRNAARAITGISVERGITVSIYTTEEGFITARFGDYEYVETGDGDGKYYFRPLEDSGEWKRVDPREMP